MRQMTSGLIITFLVLSIIGCGSSNNLPISFPKVLFQDKFEYPVATPWVPSNGWSEVLGTDTWNIVSGGVSGNALQYNATGSKILINDFSESNYRISVLVKPVNIIAGGWPFGIIGRYQDNDNCYFTQVFDDTTNIWFSLRRIVAGVETPIQADVHFKTGHLDPDTWYTLTLTADGTTVTSTFSGGGDTATLTGTETNLTSGKVGIKVQNNDPAYNAYFDNFTVKAP